MLRRASSTYFSIVRVVRPQAAHEVARLPSIAPREARPDGPSLGLGPTEHSWDRLFSTPQGRRGSPHPTPARCGSRGSERRALKPPGLRLRRSRETGRPQEREPETRGRTGFDRLKAVARGPKGPEALRAPRDGLRPIGDGSASSLRFALLRPDDFPNAAKPQPRGRECAPFASARSASSRRWGRGSSRPSSRLRFDIYA